MIYQKALKDKPMLSLKDGPINEENIANHIREIRLELGLTQEQFATKLGVTFPTVNRWENQKAKPSPLAIQKLTKLFKNLQRKQKSSKKEPPNKMVDLQNSSLSEGSL